MDKSQEITNLAKALNLVQQNVLSALKGVENKFFKSKYADLNAVWEAARKPMTDSGLSVSQLPVILEDGTFALETILFHISGEWISGKYPIRPDKETPQGYGSAVTYARRYSFAAIIGVVTEDDDAEGAMNRKKAKTKDDKKIKEDMEQDRMSPYDRAQIVNKGLDYGDGITRKEVEAAVRWYAGTIKQDPNSGVVATHCLDAPGIIKIIGDFMDVKKPEIMS